MNDDELIEYILSSSENDEKILYYIGNLITKDEHCKIVTFNVKDGDKERIPNQNFVGSSFEVNGLADYSNAFYYDKHMLDAYHNKEKEWGSRLVINLILI